MGHSCSTTVTVSHAVYFFSVQQRPLHPCAYLFVSAGVFGGFVPPYVSARGCAFGEAFERQQVVISSPIPLSSVHSTLHSLFFNPPTLIPCESDSRTSLASFNAADHPRLCNRALTAARLVIYSAVRYSGDDKGESQSSGYHPMLFSTRSLACARQVKHAFIVYL